MVWLANQPYIRVYEKVENQWQTNAYDTFGVKNR